MPIAIGSRIPEASFMVKTGDKSAPMTTADVFAGKKVVLFAVPGAYTPTCHLKHLPGFLNNIDAFKKKGIDTIACTAVNDHHVMAAWGKDTGADGRILLLADGTAAFAKAMGLAAELGALGIRSQRYAAYVDDGVVKILNVESAPGVEASSAEAMLAQLPG
jgi:glutaredoxin/glutathione-dependent peroxiredoxin